MLCAACELACHSRLQANNRRYIPESSSSMSLSDSPEMSIQLSFVSSAGDLLLEFGAFAGGFAGSPPPVGAGSWALKLMSSTTSDALSSVEKEGAILATR